MVVEIRQIHDTSEVRSQKSARRRARSKPSDRNLPAPEGGRKRAISCVQTGIEHLGRSGREAIRQRRILELSKFSCSAGHVDVGPMQVDPEGGHEWYKRFSAMTVCGEGELVKTFLLPGQAAKGQRL